jgi:hypothetical protein
MARGGGFLRQQSKRPRGTSLEIKTKRAHGTTTTNTKYTELV